MLGSAVAVDVVYWLWLRDVGVENQGRMFAWTGLWFVLVVG